MKKKWKYTLRRQQQDTKSAF